MKSGTLLSRFTGAVVQNKTILCIVILALCIRMVFFFAQIPWDEQALHSRLVGKGDALGYHRLALSLLHNKSFVFWNTRTIIRPPGYPIFISLLYFFWGPNTWIVLLLQAFLDTITVIIVYLIAREIFTSRTKQNIAAFLYSISFLGAYLATRFMSEILFTFVFALSMLFFIRALKTSRTKWYILSGCMIGVAALIRQAAIYVPVILCIVVLFQKRRFIARFFSVLIIVVAFLATLSPWLIRSKLVFGHFALTNHTGFIIGRDNAAMVKANVEKISLAEARNQLLGDTMEKIDDPFEKSRACRNIGIEYLSNNMMSALKYNIRGIIFMFIVPETYCFVELFGLEAPSIAEEEQNSKYHEGIMSRVFRAVKRSRHQYFIPLILGMKLLLEYLFLVIGLVVMFRNRQILYAALFSLIILYFGLLPGIQGMTRYKIPIVPLYLILSANGVTEIWKLKRFRRTTRG